MNRLGEFFARWVRRLLPDPLVLACLLTLVVLLIAVAAPKSDELAAQPVADRCLAAAGLWLDGLWNPGFLAFALQMCFILLAGFGLARAPAVERLLDILAARVHTGRGAVALAAAVSCAGCWINWGFGLILGGVFAARLHERLATRGIRANAALVVAASYSGMMIWHGGLSASAPLKVAEQGVPLAGGGFSAPLLITQTVLSPGNLALTAIFLIGIPLVFRWMAGSDSDSNLLADTSSNAAAPMEQRQPNGIEPATSPSLADRLGHTRVIPLAIAAVALVAIGVLLYRRGAAAIDLNLVNTVFLVAGLLLHGSLARYGAAVAASGPALVGIVLQFPLYAGIQGVMQNAGLAAALSEAFVSAAAWGADHLGVGSGVTFPIAAFASAGVVNVFIPSGGGQWIVQGPILCDAAARLGVPIPQAVMALAYGDQWTNMVQPFWALPLMGLTGVSVRRFMGYCVLLMLLAAPVFVAGLILMY